MSEVGEALLEKLKESDEGVLAAQVCLGVAIYQGVIHKDRTPSSPRVLEMEMVQSSNEGSAVYSVFFDVDEVVSFAIPRQLLGSSFSPEGPGKIFNG